MPAAIKANDYVEQLSRGVHNWGTHAFKWAFATGAPLATHSVLADIGQIATAGGYTGGAGGGLTADTVSLSETAGTASLAIADEVFVASGAPNPFRGVWLYNDTPSAPADPLVLGYDYGSSLQLADGESFTIDVASTLWTLA